MVELPIFGSRAVGSRLATKVRVMAGAFAGERGIVVKVHHPGAIDVRLHRGGREVVLPFAQSELEEVRS